MNTNTRHNVLRTFAATLLLCSATQAGASDWKWSVTPYAWATDLGVDVVLADREVLDKEIAFTDLLEDIETVAQVHVEAQRGAHGVMFDLFDVQLAKDDSRITRPAVNGAPGINEAVLSSEIGMTIFEVGGLYDPRGDQQGFSLLYGSRILDQRAEIDARYDLASGTSTLRSYETRETLVDGLLGVRYVKRFSPRWSYLARIDASTGGTRLTWSAGSSVAYAFGSEGRYALTAGYRYMLVDFKSEDSLDADMTLSGFGAGLRVSF
jgi:hypothetical protein